MILVLSFITFFLAHRGAVSILSPLPPSTKSSTADPISDLNNVAQNATTEPVTTQLLLQSTDTAIPSIDLNNSSQNATAESAVTQAPLHLSETVSNMVSVGQNAATEQAATQPPLLTTVGNLNSMGQNVVSNPVMTLPSHSGAGSPGWHGKAPGDKSIVKYETNLLEDIIGNYSSGMRPVRSSDTPAIIAFELKLKKLVKLDTKEQVLVVDAFVVMRWKDPQLQWNASKYNGTDIVNIPNKHIWTPDIVLYNTAENIGKAYREIYNAPVIARSNGTVLWTNAVTLKASCDINIKWFPVDSQVCPLTFGSWSYSGSRLKIVFNQQPTSQLELTEESIFVSNGVWDFLGFTSDTSAKEYSCCEEPFSQIEYRFQLKRRPTFFLLYLIFPCIAIVILALLSFVIPPEAGERIGFGVTVILSFSVYLIVIADKLPEKSDKSPLLGILYVLVFYILVFSFVASTINVRLYFNKTRPPHWLFNLAQGSRSKSFFSMGKTSRVGQETRKMEVKSNCQEDHEMVAKGTDDINFEKDKNVLDNFCKDEEDTYQIQWQAISAYLDKVFFKVVASVVVAVPLIVIVSL